MLAIQLWTAVKVKHTNMPTIMTMAPMVGFEIKVIHVGHIWNRDMESSLICDYDRKSFLMDIRGFSTEKRTSRYQILLL